MSSHREGIQSAAVSQLPGQHPGQQRGFWVVEREHADQDPLLLQLPIFALHGPKSYNTIFDNASIHHGGDLAQLVQSQGKSMLTPLARRPISHQICTPRSPTLVPPTLQSRLQSLREDLRPVEGGAEEGRASLSSV